MIILWKHCQNQNTTGMAGWDVIKLLHIKHTQKTLNQILSGKAKKKSKWVISPAQGRLGREKGSSTDNVVEVDQKLGTSTQKGQENWIPGTERTRNACHSTGQRTQCHLVVLLPIIQFWVVLSGQRVAITVTGGQGPYLGKEQSTD